MSPILRSPRHSSSVKIPNLDLFVPTRSAAVATDLNRPGITLELPPTLLRWNVRPRKGNTIVYCTRFLYRPGTAPPPDRLQQHAPITAADSLAACSSDEVKESAWMLDSSTRSVLRLKPHHVASFLVALNGGGITHPSSAVRGILRSSHKDVAFPGILLRDEMFTIRVALEQQNVKAPNENGAALTTRSSLRCSGFVWRDGFVSCDHWSATNDDSGDDGAYPYPLLVIDDAAQMSALRLFLESALNVSFGFHGES
jgi:hypothetical protein